MNEREKPADEFERAPKSSESDSETSQSFSESPVRPELASAYSRRSRRASGPPAEEATSSANAVSTGDSRQSEYRLRDFRPESAAPVLPTFGAPPSPAHPEPMRDVPTWTPPAVDDDGHLSYHTQAVPMSARPQNRPPAVIDSVPAEFAAPPRPMTRRELRELESRQGTRPQADDAPAAFEPAPVVRPDPPVVPAAPAAPRSVEPQPVVTAAPPAPEADEAPEELIEPERPEEPVELVIPPVVRLSPPVPLPVRGPVAPTVAEQPSSAPEPIAAPEAVVFTDASGAAVPNRPPAPTPVNRGIDSAPEIFVTPGADWPAQAPTESASTPGDSFFRTGGSHGRALTTNALVIPSIPQATDITRPFSSTGEILVTGSIDLPKSFGSTGANPARYDHSDIDALFAQEDHDYAPTDAAPVRAIRAVSTHTSTHGVISAKKPPSNRLPMMMAVTAGVLAVGVAALFAAGMIFGYF